MKYYKVLYHHQQNKCYPQRYAFYYILLYFTIYLPISKLHSILAVANLLAHNNISQIVTSVKFHYKS